MSGVDNYLELAQKLSLVMFSDDTVNIVSSMNFLLPHAAKIFSPRILAGGLHIHRCDSNHILIGSL